MVETTSVSLGNEPQELARRCKELLGHPKYVSTLRKQDHNVLDGLRQLFDGQAPAWWRPAEWWGLSTQSSATISQRA
jgi:hypothetical protein